MLQETLDSRYGIYGTLTRGRVALCRHYRHFFMHILLPLFSIMMLATGGWLGQARAQDKYPTKAIEIIVPYAPGGATDSSARIVADYMKTKWGVPINVVNMPAGVRVPALLELYKAKPDGYTLLMDGMGSSSQMPLAVKNLPFDIMERTFIAIFADTPTIYVVHPDSPLKNMKDVEAEIKKDPDNFTWTSLGGAGSYDHAMRKFMKVIGVDVMRTKPVVVKGGSEGVRLAAAQSVKLGLATISSSGPSIAAKVVRPIAVTSDRRTSNFPDVPTIGEAGYSTATQADRYGPSGPPKLPSYIVDAWGKALQEMIKDPDVRQKLARLGLTPLYQNASETKARVAAELEELKQLYGFK